MRQNNGSSGNGQQQQTGRRRTGNQQQQQQPRPAVVQRQVETDEEQEEPIYYTGPPRINLSSPDALPQPRRQTRPRLQQDQQQQQQQQQSQQEIQETRTVHTFQLDGFSGAAPFMQVGGGDNNHHQEQIDPLTMGLDRIDRMMNAAMNAPVNGHGGQQFFVNPNLLVVQQQQQQQQQTQQRRTNVSTASPLRNKIVYQLECCFCQTYICGRAMRAILLADTKIELYSTDVPPSRLRLLDDDRMTQGCNCRIRDTACACCGNVMGYHVSQPCERCLEARNNGHFWMFFRIRLSATQCDLFSLTSILAAKALVRLRIPCRPISSDIQQVRGISQGSPI